jgi:hypothetical protein
MSARRYLVLTLEDARSILEVLDGSDAHGRNADLSRIRDRLRREEGADMEDLVRQLVDTDICAPCHIEGQSASCAVLWTQKQGRRLRRLLERARGER